MRYGEDSGGGRIPIRIADVADVSWADREISHLVRVDGREGIGLSIYKEAGANTVAVAETVLNAVAAHVCEAPASDDITVFALRRRSEGRT